MVKVTSWFRISFDQKLTKKCKSGERDSNIFSTSFLFRPTSHVLGTIWCRVKVLAYVYTASRTNVRAPSAFLSETRSMIHRMIHQQKTQNRWHTSLNWTWLEGRLHWGRCIPCRTNSQKLTQSADSCEVQLYLIYKIWCRMNKNGRMRYITKMAQTFEAYKRYQNLSRKGKAAPAF